MGANDGFPDGKFLGTGLGFLLGLSELGALVGEVVGGDRVGEYIGFAEGPHLGVELGMTEGAILEGLMEGATVVGQRLGISEGVLLVGRIVGCNDGVFKTVGASLGLVIGTSVGRIDG